MQTAIDFLKALSKLRTPLLDVLFQFITRFGEEIIIFGAICILYWCVSKNYAYRLGLTFFASAMLVQGLKISFCVERPFVLDPSLVPVQSAVKNATGYSFPSGHSQSAATLYGTVFATSKNKAIKVIMLLLILLVGFSRLYLGVHTYFDVGAAIILAFICIFVFGKILGKETTAKADLAVSCALSAISVFLCFYSFLMAKYGNTDFSQISDCFKSGGTGLAFGIGYYVERKYIKFDVRTEKLWQQIVKVALGAGVALIFKSVPKLIFPQTLLLDFLRYFVTISWVLVVYPIIFDRALHNKTKNQNKILTEE